MGRHCFERRHNGGGLFDPIHIPRSFLGSFGLDNAPMACDFWIGLIAFLTIPKKDKSGPVNWAGPGLFHIYFPNKAESPLFITMNQHV